MLQRMLSIICLSTLALSALASASSVRADGWTGEVGLSGSTTSGNSETSDVGLSFKFQNETKPWTHNIRGRFDYSEADSVTNKQRLEFGYKLARDIGERVYIFGNGDYYDDDFGAYESGYFIGGGIGYKVIFPDPISWKLEAGPGFRSQTLRGPLGDREEEAAVRGYSEFIYKFNDNVAATNETEVLSSASDTYIWNETALTANMFAGLALRASFRVDYHTDVPFNRENTDTITRIGVVYKM